MMTPYQFANTCILTRNFTLCQTFAKYLQKKTLHPAKYIPLHTLYQQLHTKPFTHYTPTYPVPLPNTLHICIIIPNRLTLYPLHTYPLPNTLHTKPFTHYTPTLYQTPCIPNPLPITKHPRPCILNPLPFTHLPFTKYLVYLNHSIPAS